MESFEDDFSPLQSAPAQSKTEDSSGDDVPALRLSPTGGSGGGGGGDESASTASSDVSGGGGSGKGGAPSAGGGGKPPKEEPEVIREWKQRQVAALEKKDADEEEAKLDLRQQAKKELESWYKQHNEQLAKLQQSNRSASQTSEMEILKSTDKIAPGTEWERVASLCEFNPKVSRNVKDVGRMRSVILQLKQQSSQNSHNNSTSS